MNSRLSNKVPSDILVEKNKKITERYPDFHRVGQQRPRHFQRVWFLSGIARISSTRYNWDFGTRRVSYLPAICPGQFWSWAVRPFYRHSILWIPSTPDTFSSVQIVSNESVFVSSRRIEKFSAGLDFVQPLMYREHFEGGKLEGKIKYCKVFDHLCQQRPRHF